MQIQWYPGHMKKARNEMERDLRLVDLVIELLDARAPQSSRNPDIDKLAGNKARLVILNKADLAREEDTARFLSAFKEKGIQAVALDSRDKTALKKLMPAILAATAKKRERDKARGILPRAVKAMVCGIPNVGKSTLINAIAGKSSVKTGDKPGVTKANQWIRLNKQVELLDTPGILWPKFTDQEAGIRLAWLGSINDQILPVEELAGRLVSYLLLHDPEALCTRYGLTLTDFSEGENQGLSGLLAIAKRRGFLGKGGALDTEKAAIILLDECRGGKLGRLTFDEGLA